MSQTPASCKGDLLSSVLLLKWLYFHSPLPFTLHRVEHTIVFQFLDSIIVLVNGNRLALNNAKVVVIKIRIITFLKFVIS